MTTPYRPRWAALAALLAAEAMNLLDTTVTQVAAPAIRAGLGATDGQLQWLTAGYTLPFALLLITGGRVGDIIGRRRAFVAGTGIFLLCSAICALAPSMTVLLAARVAQGAGAAMLIPQTFGLIRAMFTGAERDKALGTIGPVMALAAVCGPVLGGVLTDANLFGLGWRTVFLINLPLGAAVLAAARLLREDRAPRRPKLDLAGTMLAGAGSGLLIYPLVQGNDARWPLWTFASMALGALTLAGFARHQRAVWRRGGSPLVEPGLFGDRVFPAALLGSLVFFAAMNGLMFVLVVFLQLGLGAGPLAAGLAMVPWSLGLAAGSWLAGTVLVPRFGARTMRLGLLAGLAGLALTMPLITNAAGRFVPLMVAGIGFGLFTVPFFGNALSRVDDQQTGSASGLLNAVQQLGATAGVAVLGAAFFHPAPADGVRLALLLSMGLLAVVSALTYRMRPARVQPAKKSASAADNSSGASSAM